MEQITSVAGVKLGRLSTLDYGREWFSHGTRDFLT